MGPIITRVPSIGKDGKDMARQYLRDKDPEWRIWKRHYSYYIPANEEGKAVFTLTAMGDESMETQK